MKVLTQSDGFRTQENQRWFEILSQNIDPSIRKHAERMKNCAGYMEFYKNKSTGKVKVFANFCKSRLCCKCARFKANCNRYKLEKIIKKLESDKDLMALGLTFTMKENCTIADFKKAVRKLNKAMSNMIRTDLFSGRVGHYKALEFTKRRLNELHPHVAYLMHFKKMDLSELTGIKKMLNSKIFNDEIIGLYNWEKSFGKFLIEDSIDSTLSPEDHYYVFKQGILDDCLRRLKKGYLPRIMLQCLAKKNGLGHQVWITEPDKNYLLELCKYNTKTMEYEGSEMEELFAVTRCTRFGDFSKKYREVLKEDELLLEDDEQPTDEWESIGSVQQNVEEQMLKASNPDPEVVRSIQRLEKAGMIGYSIENIPNFKDWLDSLIEQEE